MHQHALLLEPHQEASVIPPDHDIGVRNPLLIPKAIVHPLGFLFWFSLSLEAFFCVSWATCSVYQTTRPESVVDATSVSCWV